MATSTLFGTAPPTDDDLRLVKGLIRLLKKNSVWTARTNQGLSLSVHPPPNFKFESRGLGLIISAAISFVLNYSHYWRPLFSAMKTP